MAEELPFLLAMRLLTRCQIEISTPTVRLESIPSAYTPEGLSFWFQISEEREKQDLEETIPDFDALYRSALPADDLEFRGRISSFEDGKEHRKTIFAYDSFEGFEQARGMFLEALRLIGFIGEISLETLQEIDGTFADVVYGSNLRKIVIALRKIAECCYYTNRLEEGLFAVRKAIKVAGERLRCITWFAFGVRCRILTEMGQFEEAEEAIEEAFRIKKDSSILDRVKQNLECAKTGKDLIDGPALMRKNGGKRVLQRRRAVPYRYRQ